MGIRVAGGFAFGRFVDLCLRFGAPKAPGFALNECIIAQRVQSANIQGLWSQIPLRVWFFGTRVLNFRVLGLLR